MRFFQGEPWMDQHLGFMILLHSLLLPLSIIEGVQLLLQILQMHCAGFPRTKPQHSVCSRGDKRHGMLTFHLFCCTLFFSCSYLLQWCLIKKDLKLLGLDLITLCKSNFGIEILHCGTELIRSLLCVLVSIVKHWAMFHPKCTVFGRWYE